MIRERWTNTLAGSPAPPSPAVDHSSLLNVLAVSEFWQFLGQRAGVTDNELGTHRGTP